MLEKLATILSSRKESSQEKALRSLELQKKQEEVKQTKEARDVFKQGLSSIRDLISPSAMEIDYDHLRVSEKYVRTLFTYAYPRFLYTNWLSPIINFDATIDLSMFIYPVESQAVLNNLRKRVAQMESTISITAQKGDVRDPSIEAAYQDAEQLRDQLQTGELKFFQLGLYFTLYADSKEALDDLDKSLNSILGSTLIYTKTAHLQQEQGFNSALPLAEDEINITRNMDTPALSSTFPFTSTELSSNDGVLYGINSFNNTLIIFDRYNMENANSVVFAKSGSGKSYAVKLEALRYLMFDTEVLVIDPENEFSELAYAVGGSVIDVSIESTNRINPFDLPEITEEESGEEVLRANVIALESLLKLMLGELSTEEEAILDQALYETYAIKDITADPLTHKNEPPIMNDLHGVLKNIRGAEKMATKLERFTTGTFGGLFNKPTNVKLNREMIVFSIKNLQDELRPIAMHLIINYIWNRVKSSLKKRMLIVDEAWLLMQYEDSARFLYSIAKRARKYYLGLTTVSQDVEDMLDSKWGRAIVSNSSIQLLLKQAPSAVDKISEVFKLTQGEKYRLLNANIGEGLFFAGLNHVAIHVHASYEEHQLITTNPQEKQEAIEAKASLGSASSLAQAKKAAKELAKKIPDSIYTVPPGEDTAPALNTEVIEPPKVDDTVLPPLQPYSQEQDALSPDQEIDLEDTNK